MQTETVQRATANRALDWAKIYDLDRQVNAFVEVLDLDEPVKGELSDLSFGVKETIEQAGCATPLGVSFLHHRRGATNAPVLDQVLATGARRVGTTRSTVLAIAGDSGTRNPLDRSRSPGGSSAGSAAAVAAGFVDFALGTQTVGSIIRPASYCGVVGFKPTFGTVSVDGVARLAPELDHIGVIARNTEIALRVARKLEVPGEGHGAYMTAYVAKPWFGLNTDPSVSKAITRCVERLKAAGLRIEDFQLPEEITAREANTLQGLLCKGISDHHRDFIEAQATRLPAELVALARDGASISGTDHTDLLERQLWMRRAMDALVEDDAVIVLPAVIDAPPKLGNGTGHRGPQRLFTLLGWPAICLPMGVYENDLAHLSVGVQLAAKPGRDFPLLELARQIEDQVGP